jgi:hypothetical protein
MINDPFPYWTTQHQQTIPFNAHDENQAALGLDVRSDEASPLHSKKHQFALR